jgi:DNA-binding GntR family transcriptional regulator
VAAARQLLEGAVVQVGQQLTDGRVELGQAEQAPVAQPRKDPAFDDLHADFHLGLVARATWPSWKHRHAVVR